MKALVIIPTYNERSNVEQLIAAIHHVDPALHVLVVDDNSPDGTGELVAALAMNDERVRVLRRAGKLGLGTAYIAGFRYALAHDYERVLQMDADFSHQPADLVRLLRASDDADLVIGSRNIRGGRVENWSLLRRAVSRGGSLYTRLLLGVPVHDCTAGFKCWRRHLLAALDLDAVQSNGYGFQVELNYLAHLHDARIVEVPVVFPNRMLGESKMSGSIFWEAMVLVWKLRRAAGQRRITHPHADVV